MANDELHVEGVLERDREKSILVRVEKVDGALYLGDEEKVWFPKSQVDWTEGAEVGDDIDVVVPSWLAEERGL